MAKFQVRFDGDMCKGCGLCILFCPKKIIVTSSRINNKGYSPSEIADMDECIGCKSCAVVCPDRAISIYKEEAAK